MVYGCKKKWKSVCGEEIAVAADGAETEKKRFLTCYDHHFMVCGSYHWRCGDDGGGTDGKGSGAETVYSWV